MNDSPQQEKKQPTPEQKANAQAKAVKYGQLILDATSNLGVSFLSTLITWASLIGINQAHIPFLPVWLASFGALMMVRHLGRTWGKAKSTGQLEAQMEAYKLVMLQQATMMPTSDAAEQFRNLLKQQSDGNNSGPYL